MTISIKGKEYPYHFGMGAIELYCNAMDCDIEGLSMIDSATSRIGNVRAITTLILSAVQNGCEINRVPFDVSYREMQVVLDEMDQPDFNDIMENFAKSKYLGKTMSEHLMGSLEPEYDKKKVS